MYHFSYVFTSGCKKNVTGSCICTTIPVPWETLEAVGPKGSE